MKKKRIFLVTLVMVLITTSLSSCSFLESKITSLKASLIGVSYTAEFFDNYGAKFLTVSGDNINITGNIVEEAGIECYH